MKQDLHTGKQLRHYRGMWSEAKCKDSLKECQREGIVTRDFLEGF